MEQAVAIRNMVVFTVRRTGGDEEKFGVVVPDHLVGTTAAEHALPTLRAKLPETEDRGHDLYLPGQVFFDPKEDDKPWSVPEIHYAVTPVLASGDRYFILTEVAAAASSEPA